MTVDPKGVKPGVSKSEEEREVLKLMCRSENCDSIEAYAAPDTESYSRRRYICVKCGYSWGLNLGGHIAI